MLLRVFWSVFDRSMKEQVIAASPKMSLIALEREILEINGKFFVRTTIFLVRDIQFRRAFVITFR